MANLEQPINRNPCMFLDCRRMLGYLEKRQTPGECALFGGVFLPCFFKFCLNKSIIYAPFCHRSTCSLKRTLTLLHCCFEIWWPHKFMETSAHLWLKMLLVWCVFDCASEGRQRTVHERSSIRRHV